MRARWGELPPRCGVACRKDTARGRANRLRWGCDSEARGDGWGTRCWRCLAHGRSADCHLCKGAGVLVFRRCPSVLVTSDVDLAVDCVRAEGQGILPVPGGSLDQAHVYTLLRAVVNGEWAACEARDLERNATE